jgi:hypothetical protein
MSVNDEEEVDANAEEEVAEEVEEESEPENTALVIK